MKIDGDPTLGVATHRLGTAAVCLLVQAATTGRRPLAICQLTFLCKLGRAASLESDTVYGRGITAGNCGIPAGIGSFLKNAAGLPR